MLAFFQVGPAGSQFGLLACLVAEVLYAWPILKHPKKALFKLLVITGVLFIVGLLPWVDNYAHLFGFIFGFLLSYGLLPFISFGEYDRQKKKVMIWVCLLSSFFAFICMILFFYIIPVYDCKICSYFNCLPLTQDFCASQDINFRREEPAVWRLAKRFETVFFYRFCLICLDILFVLFCLNPPLNNLMYLTLRYLM